LEHCDLAGVVDEGGDELGGTGAGADDADAGATQVEVVVPAGGVQDRTGEGAREAWDARDVQCTGREEEEAGAVERSGAGVDVPTRVGVVPAAVGDLGVVVDVSGSVYPVREESAVAEDLVMLGVSADPAGKPRERVGVQGRVDVALATGIGVLAPGATGTAAAFEDVDCPSAASEVVGGAESGEAAADDEHFGVDHLNSVQDKC
jgi:hypothetical protein